MANNFNSTDIVVWNETIACYSYIRELVFPDDEIRISTEEERLRYFAVQKMKPHGR